MSGITKGSVVDPSGQVLANCQLFMYRRTDGTLLGNAVSDENGNYEIAHTAQDGEQVFVVCLDNDVAPDFEGIVHDRITVKINSEQPQSTEGVATAGMPVAVALPPDGADYPPYTYKILEPTGTNYAISASDAYVLSEIAGIGAFAGKGVAIVTLTDAGANLVNSGGELPALFISTFDSRGLGGGATRLPIHAGNHFPTADNVYRTISTGESIAATATDGLLSAASDADGDVLQVVGFYIGDIAKNMIGIQPVHLSDVGVIEIYSDGGYSFVPDEGFVGSLPIITCLIQDANGGIAFSTLEINVIDQSVMM